MLIEQFFEPGFGHASYLCADPDAGVAFLVDPGRDVETYLGAASRLGVLITHSFETHIHNDYLSGSAALARLRPITVVTGEVAELAYPHLGLKDGESVRVGELEVCVVATPGHTPEHVSFLVADLRRAADPQYLFSGGALLVGHIARVDLLGPELEEKLARSAFDTLSRKVLTLPDYVAVFPTHGGGSSCSGTVAGSRWTTLGFERLHNGIARSVSEGFSQFQALLRSDLPAIPPYYPKVRALNAAGPTLPSRVPLPQLSEAALGQEASATLLDPRPPHVFGAGFRRGALNVVGNEAFAARVGAAVPHASPVVILTEDAEQAERLRQQLLAIGFDDVRGYASPAPEGVSLELQEQLDAPAAAERSKQGDLLVDVREPAEWAQGHAPGAIHVPYPELRARLDEISRRRPVIAYCASGIRSSLAASILAAEGHEARNLRGGFASWVRSGLEVVS